jgi:hypothetical protein
MDSGLEWLTDLEASAARAVEHGAELLALPAADELEVLRRLGAVRDAVSKPLSVLASDIARKSERSLGAEGLARRSGFGDGLALIQGLTGVGRGEAAMLVRVGGLRESGGAVASVLPPIVGADADAPAGASAESRPAPPAVPPERSVAVLGGSPGGWDSPIALALHYDWLTAAQADALRTGLGSPRLDSMAADWRRAVLELISDTWVGHWRPEDLGKAAKRTRASLDGLAAQIEAAQRFEQRSFRRVVRASGMVHYDIDLDPESDARVFGPIKRLLSPRFGGPRFTSADDIVAADRLVEDPRSNEQLQVDTLVDLIDRGVRADEGALFKTLEPQVMVAVTSADLRKAYDTAAARRRHRAGDHGGCPGATSASGCSGPDAGIAWIDGTDHPITAVDALRMVCAGGFTPALFDESGQAIDIGRAQRYFTAKQRRAMAGRDGGCMFPGCERPPADCEAHHINPWARSVRNRISETRDGILLCRRHHKAIHDAGAHVERLSGRYRLHWPGREPLPLYSKSAVQTQLKTHRGAA